ncbi:MAG: hypothetical protein ACYTG0_06710 [Planctomycetota bacterium]|jgi:hypothetical protein
MAFLLPNSLEDVLAADIVLASPYGDECDRLVVVKGRAEVERVLAADPNVLAINVPVGLEMSLVRRPLDKAIVAVAAIALPTHINPRVKRVQGMPRGVRHPCLMVI